MNENAAKAVTVATPKLFGFIVSGHRSDSPQDSNAALVAVLAENQEAAFAVVISGDVRFRPDGCIQESDLLEQLALLKNLHLKNPNSTNLGFVVGGYVGDVPTDKGSGMIALLASSADAAIVQSVEIEPDFHPTGCLQEPDLKNYADAIQRLRSTPYK